MHRHTPLSKVESVREPPKTSTPNKDINLARNQFRPPIRDFQRIHVPVFKRTPQRLGGELHVNQIQSLGFIIIKTVVTEQKDEEINFKHSRLKNRTVVWKYGYKIDQLAATDVDYSCTVVIIGHPNSLKLIGDKRDGKFWRWETVGYGVQDSTHWYDFMNKVNVLLGLPSGANRIMKRLMRENLLFRESRTLFLDVYVWSVSGLAAHTFETREEDDVALAS
ncbi:hypothetical protein LXL04_004668 [Taraxacum kok-saghyz]